MDLEKIIEDLNKKDSTRNIGLSDLNELNFTEPEKALIKTYQPEKSFIIYGTLAPDRPNYSVIEHIKGKWQKGIVRGKLENKGWGADLGYNAFRPTSPKEQEEIKVFVLLSDELVSNWKFLDEFEGNEYRRILAKFELENGQIGVGYIYALNEEQ